QDAELIPRHDPRTPPHRTRAGVRRFLDAFVTSGLYLGFSRNGLAWVHDHHRASWYAGTTTSASAGAGCGGGGTAGVFPERARRAGGGRSSPATCAASPGR